MTTGHVFMAMSLDGCVARKNHALDWLIKQQTDGEDHGFDDFVASTDGMIMGSGSFKNTLNFAEWPYTKPVVVMSQSLTQDAIPEELQGKACVSQLNPKALMASLEKEGRRRVYVDGGQIVQSFIREGLIKDMTVTFVPILIGEGRRLFGETNGDIDLELIGSKLFKSGLLQAQYKVL